MKCGQGIHVKDWYGAYVVRFIAQCEGRFLMITNNNLDYRNGYLLADWRGVLREMVGMAVPAKLIEKTRSVEAHGPGGLYAGFPLTYPLSVQSLAAALWADPGEVRAELADLAVQHEV